MLEAGTNDLKEETYSVISYPATAIPKAYRNMVFSKWMRSLRYGNDYFKMVDSDKYYFAYQRYIEMLLSRPECVIRFAVVTDEPDTVLGWSLIQGDKLHYVWVQQEQRNKGIATMLVPVSINCISHITKAGLSIWNKKLPHATLNPF